MAGAFSRHILGNWWLLCWQNIPHHHLSSRNVLLHVAVEEPSAWVVSLEPDDSPAPPPDCNHVLLKWTVKNLFLLVLRGIIWTAPVRIVLREVRMWIARAHSRAVIEHLGHIHWEEKAFKVCNRAPLLRERSVVDHHLDSLVLLDGYERNALSTTLTLGMQQGCLRLLPSSRVGEHIHLICGVVRRDSWLEVVRLHSLGTQDSNVECVAHVWLLQLRDRNQILDSCPIRGEVGVPGWA